MDFALILDLVVIVIILISAAVAFLRGFVREVLTIVGLVGAALVAFTAGPALTPGMEDWLTSDIAAEDIDEAKMWGMIPYDIASVALTYAGLFLVTLIVLSILSHYIAKSVHAIGLGPVDRSLGVVFGVARGLVLIGLLYMPFHILMEKKDKEDWFGTSQTFSYVEATSEFLVGFIPESWERKTRESEEEESLDPLKDLTGENEDETSEGAEAVDPEAIGTDEEAAERSQGFNDIEKKAIDSLIENQDRIKGIIQNMPENNSSESGNE